MLIKDALALLELSGNVTQDDIRAAYKAMCKKYHPDINPAGETMMKLINAARDALADFEGQAEEQGETQADYGEALNAAIAAIIDLPGLEIEVCGAWVWVGGNTYAHKDQLKAAGFKYASKKQRWNFRPAGWRSYSRGNTTMDDIREKYGSRRPSRPAGFAGAQLSA